MIIGSVKVINKFLLKVLLSISVVRSFHSFMSSSSHLSSSQKVLSVEMIGKLTNLLTKDETKLFKVLLDSLKRNQKKTVARVVGGWVRDKLLGRASDDIDIALDDQSGVEFANNVNKYLKTIGEDYRKIAVIQVRSFSCLVKFCLLL